MQGIKENTSVEPQCQLAPWAWNRIGPAFQSDRVNDRRTVLTNNREMLGLASHSSFKNNPNHAVISIWTSNLLSPKATGCSDQREGRFFGKRHLFQKLGEDIRVNQDIITPWTVVIVILSSKTHWKPVSLAACIQIRSPTAPRVAFSFHSTLLDSYLYIYLLVYVPSALPTPHHTLHEGRAHALQWGDQCHPRTRSLSGQ